MGNHATGLIVGAPKIIRRGPGQYELRIPRPYRALLRNLPDELKQVLETDHPSLRRLFPNAYPDDPERAAEFDAMVRADLLEGKRKALDLMQATIDAPRLNEEELCAWVGVLNDLRLFLGTTLNVAEDTYDEPTDQTHPEARGLAIYSYLSWLQEQAVQALAADLH